MRVRVKQIADAGSTSAVLLGSRRGDVRVRPSALEEWCCIVDWWGILLSRNFRRCTVTDALLCSSSTHREKDCVTLLRATRESQNARACVIARVPPAPCVSCMCARVCAGARARLRYYSGVTLIQEESRPR